MYQIVGVLEKEEPVVQVRVKGTSKIFQKTAKELYETKWLSNFSREDVAYIGVLNASGYNEALKRANEIASRAHSPMQNVIILGMLFICFLIMSNITAMKVAAISLPSFDGILPLNFLEFSAGLIFFPVTFMISDILTEVYGYRMSRTIIWGGCVCNAIFLIGLTAAVEVSPSPIWLETQRDMAHSYEILLGVYAKVFLASSIAYFFGEFMNSMLIAKIKIATAGKYLAARLVGSTFVGAMVDTLIFTYIVFYGVVSLKLIVTIIIVEIVFKVMYEVLMLPITIRVIHYLKKKDGVDHYDFDTKFNPFSLKN